jgi:hypothetical protein
MVWGVGRLSPPPFSLQHDVFGVISGQNLSGDSADRAAKLRW